MGGYGSGRHGFRQTADACNSLDAGWMNRHGCLSPGGSWSISWNPGGHPSGSIGGFCPQVGRIVLVFRYRKGADEWEDAKQPVEVVYTSCNYGGRRPWFLCPGVRSGVPCRRRVGKLFAGGKWFLCRHCYGLNYQSQKEKPEDRLRTKAQGIRRQLGGSGSLLNQFGGIEPFPVKPPRMHWKTYSRLYVRAREAEQRHWRLLAEWLDRREAHGREQFRRAGFDLS